MRFKLSTLFFLTAFACILVQATWSPRALDCLIAFFATTFVFAIHAAAAGRNASLHASLGAVAYISIIYFRFVLHIYSESLRYRGKDPYFEDGWLSELIIIPGILFAAIAFSAVIGFVIGAFVGYSFRWIDRRYVDRCGKNSSQHTKSARFSAARLPNRLA
jgi:hypothetical protein